MFTNKDIMVTKILIKILNSYEAVLNIDTTLWPVHILLSRFIKNTVNQCNDHLFKHLNKYVCLSKFVKKITK